ncbi:hypothetical protein DPEC_G00052330 [Dallia pectoralis]|uniref:Uncharacterized protein n=1 Tax=Dallia pectoralis TaxID=75939 RepID=A0ACC2HBE7_DALPE|nr:hypothetical protein DPEC_G00052330 [Dallia pectoralis]
MLEVFSLTVFLQLLSSQRETSKLRLQLNELQLKCVLLEKQHAEYKAMRTVLENKQSYEKLSQCLSEEVERLKEQNSKTENIKKSLEDQLRTVTENSAQQNLENIQLKQENTSLERDLLKTQTSLKSCQKIAEEVQHWKEENARMSFLKHNLEKQLKTFEDSKVKQDHVITKLNTQNCQLERNLLHLQEQLEKMEKDRNKVLNSISTQATPRKEPQFDKEKAQRLLEELWLCVNPASTHPSLEHTMMTSHLPENCASVVPAGGFVPLVNCNWSRPPALRDNAIQSSPSTSAFLRPLPQNTRESLQDARKKTDRPARNKKHSAEQRGQTAAADGQKLSSPSLITPPPTSGVPSSPLLFGSATPKHAVPVPGRLPAFSSSSSSSPAQENSMRILDSMYPELSARARTLSILRGNLGDTASSTVSQISGFKAINSSSTAFTKTNQRGKRSVNMLPQSAKRLRLDNCSLSPGAASARPDPVKPQHGSSLEGENASGNPEGKATPSQHLKPAGRISISQALEKISAQCFDLLPVVKVNVSVGNLSRKPILRDEEKEIVYDFANNQSTGDDLMAAVLGKLKSERSILSGSELQALVRVYTALCRQRRDWTRVQVLACSILQDDFPECIKLILFMVTTWPNVFSGQTLMCQAIHTVSKLKAQQEVLQYLTAYLGWETCPPSNLDQMVYSTLKSIRAADEMSFQKHPRQGQDLNPFAWQHVLTLELLCSHAHWTWTHDNLLSKELWPIMNSWVTQPRSGQTPIKDVTVATVLRLIGRLGQIGLKERCVSSVKNIAKIINAFTKHGQSEGVPWEVQLAAVYTVYDLSPSDPKEALSALASWRGETTQPVPPAVTSCITQIASLCRTLKD